MTNKKQESTSKSDQKEQKPETNQQETLEEEAGRQHEGRMEGTQRPYYTNNRWRRRERTGEGKHTGGTEKQNSCRVHDLVSLWSEKHPVLD